MSGEDLGTAGESNRRFQFSLATLMGLMAGCSLFFGMVAWKGEQGAFLFFLGVGGCLIVLGIFLRRIGLILAGAAAVVLMFMAVSFSAGRIVVTTASIWRAVPIRIEVVDAASKEPVAGAEVSVRSRSDLSPTAEEVPADADGVAEVTAELSYSFTRYRTMFGTRTERSISFAGATVHAGAEGYQALDRPLSAYLGKSRELSSAGQLVVRVEMVRKRPQEQPPEEPPAQP